MHLCAPFTAVFWHWLPREVRSIKIMLLRLSLGQCIPSLTFLSLNWFFTFYHMNTNFSFSLFSPSFQVALELIVTDLHSANIPESQLLASYFLPHHHRCMRKMLSVIRQPPSTPKKKKNLSHFLKDSSLRLTITLMPRDYGYIDSKLCYCLLCRTGSFKLLSSTSPLVHPPVCPLVLSPMHVYST